MSAPVPLKAPVNISSPPGRLRLRDVASAVVKVVSLLRMMLFVIV